MSNNYFFSIFESCNYLFKNGCAALLIAAMLTFTMYSGLVLAQVVEDDSVSYQHSAAGVQAALDGTPGKGGDAEGDVWTKKTNLTGSNYDDDLTGNINGNKIDGLNGNDRMNGKQGVDFLSGGPGDDVYVGMGGDHFDSVQDGGGVDELHFAAGIDRYNIWLVKNASPSANSLRVYILGTDHIVEITSAGLLDDMDAIDIFKTHSGWILKKEKVQNLIADMEKLASPPFGGTFVISENIKKAIAVSIDKAWIHDSDLDGVTDSYELQVGTDPNDASSVPKDVDKNGVPDILESLVGVWESPCVYLGGGEYQKQYLTITLKNLKRGFFNAVNSRCLKSWLSVTNDYEYSLKKTTHYEMDLKLLHVTATPTTDKVTLALNQSCSKTDYILNKKSISDDVSCGQQVIFPSAATVHYELLEVGVDYLRMGDKIDTVNIKNRAVKFENYTFTRVVL